MMLTLCRLNFVRLRAFHVGTLLLAVLPLPWQPRADGPCLLTGGLGTKARQRGGRGDPGRT